MKTNPLAEVSKDRTCAHCGSGSIQNQVFRFIGTDDRRLNLCNSCVIELRRMSDSPTLCAFCGRRAKYATWKLETTRGLGTLTFDDGNNLPEHWLFCEVHFSELYQEVQERVVQRQLSDY